MLVHFLFLFVVVAESKQMPLTFHCRSATNQTVAVAGLLALPKLRATACALRPRERASSLSELKTYASMPTQMAVVVDTCPPPGLSLRSTVLSLVHSSNPMTANRTHSKAWASAANSACHTAIIMGLKARTLIQPKDTKAALSNQAPQVPAHAIVTLKHPITTMTATNTPSLGLSTAFRVLHQCRKH